MVVGGAVGAGTWRSGGAGAGATSTHVPDCAALRLDGRQHPLHARALGEGRRRGAPLGDAGEQVGGLVDERVVPPEHVARRPPGADVRVVGLGHQDAGAAGAGVDDQLVERLELEAQRPLGAVDLEGEAVLAPVRHPAHLDAGHRPARGAERGPRRVVDGDVLGTGLAGPGGDEGAQVPARPGDRVAEEELHLVDHVRPQVAEGAGAGLLLAEPPGHRGVRVDQPVLEVRRAHLADLAEAAGGDELAGQGQGRHPAVVEARPSTARRGRRRPRRRRRAPRTRRRCWPAASRAARACRRPARPRRSRRAGGPGCRCRRPGCRRARARPASRWRTPASRSGRRPRGPGAGRGRRAPAARPGARRGRRPRRCARRWSGPCP